MRPGDEDSQDLIIPVVQETVGVDTVKVPTGAGVRVQKRVRVREEPFEVSLERDELSVERVPVEAWVEGPAPVTRTEGEVTIVPVLEEVLVVEKRLRLKEEIRITRRPRREQVPRTARLRSEEVTVERFENEPNPGARHG
ncbi:MAG TPA: DUF2382 domain-containing protein [Archangium sp.]